MRSPATAAMLGERLGVYRDPWFGEALLCEQGGQVRFSARKSPKLTGEIMQVGDRLLIDWLDDEIDAEAWLDFSFGGSEGPTTLTLGKVDPEADFSYDYEDLAFVRVGDVRSPMAPTSGRDPCAKCGLMRIVALVSAPSRWPAVQREDVTWRRPRSTISCARTTAPSPRRVTPGRARR